MKDNLFYKLKIDDKYSYYYTKNLDGKLLLVEYSILKPVIEFDKFEHKNELNFIFDADEYVIVIEQNMKYFSETNKYRFICEVNDMIFYLCKMNDKMKDRVIFGSKKFYGDLYDEVVINLTRTYYKEIYSNEEYDKKMSCINDLKVELEKVLYNLYDYTDDLLYFSRII